MTENILVLLRILGRKLMAGEKNKTGGAYSGRVFLQERVYGGVKRYLDKLDMTHHWCHAEPVEVGRALRQAQGDKKNKLGGQEKTNSVGLIIGVMLSLSKYDVPFDKLRRTGMRK